MLQEPDLSLCAFFHVLFNIPIFLTPSLTCQYIDARPPFHPVTHLVPRSDLPRESTTRTVTPEREGKTITREFMSQDGQAPTVQQGGDGGVAAPRAAAVVVAGEGGDNQISLGEESKEKTPLADERDRGGEARRGVGVA